MISPRCCWCPIIRGRAKGGPPPLQRLQKEVWTSLQYRSVSAIWVMRELAARRGVAVALMPVVFTSTLGVADDLARLSFPFGSYAGVFRRRRRCGWTIRLWRTKGLCW